MSVEVRVDEQSYLNETFATLCSIASPTRDERACADWCQAELRAFGLTVDEDDAAAAVGGNAGNLLARIPGTTGRSLLFCAHLDTVPLAAPVQPILRDGYWSNDNAGILGADNKAAVAAILTLARRLSSLGTPPPVGVEILLTVAEEDGLRGADAFDVAKLSSDYGYVFDHASPIGEIILASPTYMRIRARFRGLAAHAGLEPEQGANAIVAAGRAIAGLPDGRLDDGTTANVGVIEGGSATNVVPDNCRLETEVRALDEDRLDAVVTEVIDHLQAGADSGRCDLDLDLERMFTGYRVAPEDRSFRTASAALKTIGYEPHGVASGGGADANSFRERGLDVTNIANGTERAHQLDERVSARALIDNARLMLALLDVAGKGSDGRGDADV